MAARRNPDVIVVGGGPAGSVMAWVLAREGVTVRLLERTRFPREKVCGDYVEPRGLRILEVMGCLEELERDAPLPITHSATFVEGGLRYRGRIPFYGTGADLPPHGFIIARERLDDVLLRRAAAAGAEVREECSVTGVSWSRTRVTVEVKRRGRTTNQNAALVVGADGANSVVAKHAGMLADDPRHIAVARRAYAEGMDAAAWGSGGEACFFFDEELFPGYGWVFPMAQGVVNLGVGILAETRDRLRINVPRLFDDFVDRLPAADPRLAGLRLCRPPIGGVVKTYGGAGANHFERGVLIGDAGSFVDPMTGEGITPAMESALLAAPVIVEALNRGGPDADRLSRYERDFRAYFDPSMLFLDLLAAILRNRRMSGPWLKALAGGCAAAQEDPDFARVAGAGFGGLEIDPRGILGAVWWRTARELLGAGLRSNGGPPVPGTQMSIADLIGWQRSWWGSVFEDPLLHARWTIDVQKKWLDLLPALATSSGTDPRSEGLAGLFGPPFTP